MAWIFDPGHPMLCRWRSFVFFQVSPKLVAHSRHHPVSEFVFIARTEPLKEGRAEDRHRHGLVDGSCDSPASLARIRYSTLKITQIGTLEHCVGCKVQKPRANHAASPPEFCDVGQIEIILVVFWI